MQSTLFDLATTNRSLLPDDEYLGPSGDSRFSAANRERWVNALVDRVDQMSIELIPIEQAARKNAVAYVRGLRPRPPIWQYVEEKKNYRRIYVPVGARSSFEGGIGLLHAFDDTVALLHVLGPVLLPLLGPIILPFAPALGSLEVSIAAVVIGMVLLHDATHLGSTCCESQDLVSGEAAISLGGFRQTPFTRLRNQVLFADTGLDLPDLDGADQTWEHLLIYETERRFASLIGASLMGPFWRSILVPTIRSAG